MIKPIKPIKTTNAKCRALVQAQRTFKNSNGQLYGMWHNPSLYVVYSYGEHWPLFAWDGFAWYANTDKASVTTSHHYGYAHPHTEVRERNCDWMKHFVATGRNIFRQMDAFQTGIGLTA